MPCPIRPAPMTATFNFFCTAVSNVLGASKRSRARVSDFDIKEGALARECLFGTISCPKRTPETHLSARLPLLNERIYAPYKIEMLGEALAEQGISRDECLKGSGLE